MPIYTNIAGGARPGPLEADPATSGEGFAATAASAFTQAPGVSAIEAGVGLASGGDWLTKNEAAKQLGNGYDASEIPEGGINQGALGVIRERQDSLQANQSIAARANLSGSTSFVASLVGGTPDPVNLAVTALAPEAKGAQLGTRLVRGAAEGAAIVAGGVAVQHMVHGYVGDPDVRIGDAFRDIALGGLTGGATHGALGMRVSTNDIATLEGSAAASRRSGVPVNEVTSPTGAIGLHQVEPTTAVGLGFGKTPAEAARLLKDPKINEAASQKYLDQLQREFPNDPEAQAVAYNGGPGRARTWIRDGRNDAVLPKETQGYLARYRDIVKAGRAGGERVVQIKPEELQAAIAQASHDSTVNVQPVSDGVNLAEAIPKPGSDMFVDRSFVPVPEAKPVVAGETAGPGPLETQANEHLTNAMAETKNLDEALGHEAAPQIAERDAEIADTDSLVKAVSAAVSCGARRGLE